MAAGEFRRMIAVTDRSVFSAAPDPEAAFLCQLERVFAAGPKAVVLREKDLSPEAYLALAERVLAVRGRCCRTESAETELILHGHPEAAERLGLRAVHLPLARLLALHEAGKTRGEIRFGASVHSPEEARAAEKAGAAWLFAGNVFETTCKPGKEARGLPWLSAVCAAVSVPVYGIGGISREDLPALLSAGAAGGCMMSGFMRL